MGAAAGPLIGGFLTETLSWRWFFFMNLPIALLAILLTVAVVRESRDETAGRHVDLVGLVAITGGLTALVMALHQSETPGWGSLVVVGSLVAAAVLLAAFVLVEPRLREPLVQLGLFDNRGYLGANAVAFTQNFGFSAILFFLTLYIQHLLGLSPLQAGLVFLVFRVILVICNPLAGRLVGVTGPRLPMAGGMALTAFAFFLMFLLITTASPLVGVIVTLAIAGVGQAFAYTVSATRGMAAIPESEAGEASGMLTIDLQMGAVFGVAATGALFKALENNKLTELLTAAGAKLDASDRAEIRGFLSGSESSEAELARLAPEVSQQVERVVHEAFVFALDGAMLLCVLVSIVGVLASFLVPGGAPRQTGKPRVR